MIKYGVYPYNPSPSISHCNESNAIWFRVFSELVALILKDKGLLHSHQIGYIRLICIENTIQILYKVTQYLNAARLVQDARYQEHTRMGTVGTYVPSTSTPTGRRAELLWLTTSPPHQPLSISSEQLGPPVRAAGIPVTFRSY
jgi:hypothetical protein